MLEMLSHLSFEEAALFGGNRFIEFSKNANGFIRLLDSHMFMLFRPALGKT